MTDQEKPQFRPEFTINDELLAQLVRFTVYPLVDPVTENVTLWWRGENDLTRFLMMCGIPNGTLPDKLSTMTGEPGLFTYPANISQGDIVDVVEALRMKWFDGKKQVEITLSPPVFG